MALSPYRTWFDIAGNIASTIAGWLRAPKKIKTKVLFCRWCSVKKCCAEGTTGTTAGGGVGQLEAVGIRPYHQGQMLVNLGEPESCQTKKVAPPEWSRSWSQARVFSLLFISKTNMIGLHKFELAVYLQPCRLRKILGSLWGKIYLKFTFQIFDTLWKRLVFFWKQEWINYYYIFA